MEFLALVLGVWLLAALGVALLIGRFIHVADRREHATIVTASGMPRSPRETAGEVGAAGAQETA
jgi:uncharacterized membrane protein YecN with MAPEG domain